MSSAHLLILLNDQAGQLAGEIDAVRNDDARRAERANLVNMLCRGLYGAALAERPTALQAASDDENDLGRPETQPDAENATDRV